MEQCFKQKSSFRTIRIILFSLSMLFAYATNGYAQNMVRGVVTDVTGDPLPGVSVVVKGTTTGTTTDIDGRYSINASNTATLEFSYIGMNKQEIKVNGRSTINIILKEDVANLDEVVVVGYGTQKKAHLTGSVATVSQKDMLKTTASNMSQTLVGKLPGLITQQSLGQPGSDDVSILIRGYSSFSGSGTVLVLVDGVERAMGQVDPNDVESVTILKDAASCAVYGMKAANGVVLVTTKHGQEGKTDITYRGSMTLSHATTLPKMMNGTQYMQWYNLARKLDNNGVDNPYFTDEEIAATYNGDPTDGFENTDWTSDLYKTTLMHQHNLSINGGSNKVRYFISGGYLHQDGIIKGNKNERSNFRSNIDVQATKDIKVSLNTAALIKDYYQPGGYSYGNQQAYSIFHQLLYSIPFVPKEYEGYPTSAYRGATSAANPIYGSANSGFQESRRVRIESSANVEYTAPFLKGLKANMFISWDWQDLASKTFAYAYSVNAYDSSTKSYSYVQSANLLADGNLYQGDQKSQQVILRPTISYNNKFGLHDVGALFLYEQTQVKSSALNASRTDYDLFDLPEISLGDAQTATNSGSSGKSAYAAYVGRLNYAYANKYLAEASFRYDGSYKFAKGHRWGFFPSIAVGYNISEEAFFEPLKNVFSNMKIRASWGLVGNDNIGGARFVYMPTINLTGTGYTTGLDGDITYKGPVYSRYGNPEVTWEVGKKVNVGLDLQLFNSLNLTMDYFHETRTDIFQERGTIPQYLGTAGTKVFGNLAAMKNQGFDFAADFNKKIGKDWFISFKGTFTYAHNEITKYDESPKYAFQSKVGQSANIPSIMISDGLFKDPDDVKNSNQQIGGNLSAGDIKYVNISKLYGYDDDIVDISDWVWAKNPTVPEIVYGFGPSIRWKNLDFSFFFQGVAKVSLVMSDFHPFGDNSLRNVLTWIADDRWSPDNQNINATYPRLTRDTSVNNTQRSDYWLRNAAFIKLKNAEIGYTYKNMRFYVSGMNLATFSPFKHWDPEQGGGNGLKYPTQRVFNFGFQMTINNNR